MIQLSWSFLQWDPVNGSTRLIATLLELLVSPPHPALSQGSHSKSVILVKKMEPIFSFGVVADIQYADKDTRTDHEGRVSRYREATGKLEKAVHAFNANKQNLKFVLSLGDIIDGNETTEKTESEFQEVLVRLAKLDVEAFHLLGNHCLRLRREILMEKLKMPRSYYEKDIHPGWCLIVLDTMDLSLRWPEGSQKYMEGLIYTEEHPIVEDGSSQMGTYNGGLGTDQMAWLVGRLRDAERKGKKVIVAAHHPLLEGAAPLPYLMWNYKEVSSILLGSSSFVLFLCGHYHLGGYKNVGNQHFVTIEGILEAPSDTEAHAFVHVFKDHIDVEGYGFVKSRKLDLL